MKYKHRIAGLEQRQRAYDALPVAAKNGQHRPGSLSSTCSGPSKGRRRK